MRTTLVAGLLALLAPLSVSAQDAARPTDWVLQIHGGAGTIERGRMTAAQEAEIRAALERSLAAGAAILASGGTALDAVEAAVRVLEDDANFNAGRGAVLNTEGLAELDASIMEGTGRNAGAVAGATRAKSPIALARAVMDKSPHVMLAGSGADAFARQQGLEIVDRDYFVTERRREQLKRRKTALRTGSPPEKDWKYGTVGAVAQDANGHMAAATSTGGTSAKLPGRIGDSPVIGAGTYADDRACAVSATGAGEFYIRNAVAYNICTRILFLGESAQTAADTVQQETLDLGGDGGVIVLDAAGNAAFSFNTPGMYRGRARAGEATVIGIYGEE